VWRNNGKSNLVEEDECCAASYFQKKQMKRAEPLWLLRHPASADLTMPVLGWVHASLLLEGFEAVA
jgi:hypothetical protein